MVDLDRQPVAALIAGGNDAALAGRPDGRAGCAREIEPVCIASRPRNGSDRMPNVEVRTVPAGLGSAIGRRFGFPAQVVHPRQGVFPAAGAAVEAGIGGRRDEDAAFVAVDAQRLEQPAHPVDLFGRFLRKLGDARRLLPLDEADALADRGEHDIADVLDGVRLRRPEGRQHLPEAAHHVPALRIVRTRRGGRGGIDQAGVGGLAEERFELLERPTSCACCESSA